MEIRAYWNRSSIRIPFGRHERVSTFWWILYLNIPSAFLLMSSYTFCGEHNNTWHIHLSKGLTMQHIMYCLCMLRITVLCFSLKLTGVKRIRLKTLLRMYWYRSENVRGLHAKTPFQEEPSGIAKKKCYIIYLFSGKCCMNTKLKIG